MTEELDSSTTEEKGRTLYLRLPHVIKDDKEVMSLFPGNVLVKLPRQTSKCCHVVFSTIEERAKTLKAMKNKKIDGKRIILMPLSDKVMDKLKNNSLSGGNKEALKKVAISALKPDSIPIKSLFVSNIPNGTDIKVVKEAFIGCVSIAFLKGVEGKQRAAVLNMETPQKAAAYFKKELPAPKIRENELTIRPYKKKSKARRMKKRKSAKVEPKPEN